MPLTVLDLLFQKLRFMISTMRQKRIAGDSEYSNLVACGVLNTTDAIPRYHHRAGINERTALGRVSEGCHVCCWLFRSNFFTFRACRASLFSLSSLPCMAKQAELTEEYFSKPNTLPISVNLYPPKLRHKYIAIARASLSYPRRLFPSSSTRFP